MLALNKFDGLKDPTKEILFIFGTARSGTTYLNGLIDRWFGYGMGPEGHFVAQFARKLRRYGDLSVEGNLRHLAQDVSNCGMLEIVRSKWGETARFNVTAEWIMREVSEPSYAAVVYAVFRCVAQGQHKEHVGNKDPGYWECLPLLHGLFPTQARYLSIVRDGRDVVLSTMRMPWGQKSAYICSHTWARSLEATDVFARSIDPDRFLQIRYEDLLDHPYDTIDRLGRFLGRSLSTLR